MMQVVLRVKGARRCTWLGVNLRQPAEPFCSEFVTHYTAPFPVVMKPTNVPTTISLLNKGDLSKDHESDLRILTMNFTRRGASKYTTFEWIGRRSRLVVSVDWDQEGECACGRISWAYFLSFFLTQHPD